MKFIDNFASDGHAYPRVGGADAEIDYALKGGAGK